MRDNRNHHRLTTTLFIVSLLFVNIHSTDCDLKNISLLDCYKNCRIIYKGLKNYFNSSTQLCEKVNICSDDELYDFLTNTCSRIIPDYSDFPEFPLNKTSLPIEGAILIPKINCVNGYFPTNSTICVCYPGWIDNEISNDEKSVNKCTETIPGFRNQTGNNSIDQDLVNYGNNEYTRNSTIINMNPSIANKEMPLFYKIIIVICSLLFAFYILCGIFICYKLKNKKKEKEYPIENYLPSRDKNLEICPYYYNDNNVDRNNQSFSMNNRDNMRMNPARNEERNMNGDFDDDVYIKIHNSGRRVKTYHTPVKKIKTNQRKNNTSIKKFKNSYRDYNQLYHNRYFNRNISDFVQVEDDESTKRFYNNRNHLLSEIDHSRRRSNSQDVSIDYSSSKSNQNRGLMFTPPKRVMITDILAKKRRYQSPDYLNRVRIKGLL